MYKLSFDFDFVFNFYCFARRLVFDLDFDDFFYSLGLLRHELGSDNGINYSAWQGILFLRVFIQDCG
jgi:hypothetical protein